MSYLRTASLHWSPWRELARSYPLKLSEKSGRSRAARVSRGHRVNQSNRKVE
jgi:hypothetical protein